MIQIRCDKCEYEFAITRDRCPSCGDPVKTSCKFYCGDCESIMNIKEGKCNKCKKVPDEIIIEKENGERIRTTFDTFDSEIDNKSDVEEKKEEKSPKQKEEFAKIQKLLKNDMLVLFILQLLSACLLLLTVTMTYYSIIFAIVLYFGYSEAKKGTPKAGTIGIIISIFMMLTILSSDIPDFLLGLFLLIHSIKYQKQFD